MLWSPPADARERFEVGRYLAWLEAERGLAFAGYEELFRWSVEDLEGFWGSLWDFFEIRAHAPYERVLGSDGMPGAEWFPGAQLNYAEHLLGRDEDAGTVAVVARSQSRGPQELTFGDLRDRVARARAGLQRLGVGPGDRVVAYLPNIPETLVAFAATASLGAVWATCPPEFGARSVLDRLGQLEPSVLLAVAGYRWGDRLVDRREQVAEVREKLPSAAARRPRPVRGRRRRRAAGHRLLGRAAGRAGAARVRPGAVRASALRPLLVGHDGPAEADRARARRHPARAPEEPRAELGPAPRRPAALVHDDGVDDVERARLDAARARVDRDDRRQPGLARPLVPVAARRGDARDDARPQPRVHDGLPQGGARAGTRLRPLLDPDRRRGGLAAAGRGLRVDLRAARRRRVPERRQRRHRRLHGHRAGEPAAAGLRGRDGRAAASASTRPRSPPRASRSSASSASS